MPQLYKDMPYVRELVAKDFLKNNNVSNSQDRGIVIFYAHWCPHCNNPHFINMMNALGKRLKEKETNHSIYAFNCADNIEQEKIASNLDVMGFPTIKYISRGKIGDSLEEGRDLETIIKFMIDQKNKNM